jgi:hypothetical protein
MMHHKNPLGLHWLFHKICKFFKMFEITETNGSLIFIFFPKRTKTNRWFCGLAIYIKKYLKAKEELWKLKIFHHARI